MEPVGDVGGEFEAYVSEGAFEEDDGGVDEGEGGSAVFGGVVGVRDGSGGEVAEDVGGVDLGATVVSAGDVGGEQGVAEAGADGADALAEEAGVLVEEDGVDGSGEHGSVGDVGEVGSDSFGVACGAPAEAAVGAVDLAEAAEDEGSDEVEGVGGGVEG